MRVAVVGTGYVGLTLGVGLAVKGHRVMCVDVVKEKVNKINSGIAPIFEDGLKEALKKTIGSTLLATTSVEEAVKKSEVIFIAVGTPSLPDGSIDLKYIEQAAKDIGAILKHNGDYKTVCVKSTVVPETTMKTVLPILEKTSGKKCGKDFGLAMNPEFLKEGTAMKDFMYPDRIVIGAFDDRSYDTIYRLYMETYGDTDTPILRTSLTVAEMIKYASNAFLAAKVSLSNEIGNICKALNIDTYEVMKGVGYDARIGPHFLNAGCGFGGSCFPKDVKALVSTARSLGYEPQMLNEVLELNERQKTLNLKLLERKLKGFAGKKITILGLAFKPGTDDTRESPALAVIPELQKMGAHVVVFDPMTNVKGAFPDVEHAASVEEALDGSHACLIMTDWFHFKNLEDKDFGSMESKVIIEGRKTLDPSKVSDFEGICW